MNCDLKWTYLTENTANKVLREMQARSMEPWRLNIYHCERHDGWHIGNKPIPCPGIDKAMRIDRKERRQKVRHQQPEDAPEVRADCWRRC